MNTEEQFEKYLELRKQISTLMFLIPHIDVEQAANLYLTVPDLRGMVDAAVDMQARIIKVVQQHKKETK